MPCFRRTCRKMFVYNRWNVWKISSTFLSRLLHLQPISNEPEKRFHCSIFLYVSHFISLLGPLYKLMEKRFGKFALIMKLEIENRFFESTTKFACSPSIAQKESLLINKTSFKLPRKTNWKASACLKFKVRRTKTKERKQNLYWRNFVVFHMISLLERASSFSILIKIIKNIKISKNIFLFSNDVGWRNKPWCDFYFA